jgi:hypothetical protein
VIDLTLRGREISDDDAVATRMERVGPAQVPLTPPRYGWFSALGALLAGSVGAYVGLFGLDIGFGAILHVLPGGGPAGPVPGAGWPWRIDGAWAVLADLGPLLVSAILVATLIAWFVEGRVARPTARWPIVLCATLVGWVPVEGGRAGLLGVSGGLAFVAMWWTTHQTAAIPRPRLPGTRHPRFAATVAGFLIVGLAAASVSYGALHPIRADVFTSPETTSLHDGRTDRFPISIYNEGPVAIRILGVSLSPRSDLRVARLERSGPRTEGPTIDSLFSPAGTPRVPGGGEVDLWLTLSGPAECAGMTETLDTLDVRLVVAGLTRVQQVGLGPDALSVTCNP